jgi:hypothetical protein
VRGRVEGIGKEWREQEAQSGSPTVAWLLEGAGIRETHPLEAWGQLAAVCWPILCYGPAPGLAKPN